MRGRGSRSNAPKLINVFATIKSMVFVLLGLRGDREVKVHLRTVAKSDEDVAALLSQLGIRLP